MDWDKNLPSILAWGSAIATGVFTLLGAKLASKNALDQLERKHRHEADRERREVLRLRVEELYTMISQWATDAIIHHTTFRKVMRGELTYNDALDLTIKNKSRVDAGRMFTLAELYFPTAHKALDAIKEMRDQASEIQSRYKEFYRNSGSPSSEHARELNATLENLNIAVEKYKSELAKYANEF